MLKRLKNNEIDLISLETKKYIEWAKNIVKDHSHNNSCTFNTTNNTFETLALTKKIRDESILFHLGRFK